MALLSLLKDKAKGSPVKRVVLPEGGDERVIKAALRAAGEGIAAPVLLGGEAVRRALQGREDAGISVVDHLSAEDFEAYTAELCRITGLTPGPAARLLRRPLYYAAMMLRQGAVDAMVAGAAHLTEEVVAVGKMIVGLEKGIGTPSSFFLMHTPGFSGSEGEYLVFADCAVNPNPSAEELADIAVSTARSVRALFGWEPRAAVLSFSTKGSAVHPDAEKAARAVELAREKEPGLLIDGEFQADAALVPEVARVKLTEESPVAGRANILIFPALDAGNNSYKRRQRRARAAADGPVLQGFARPVSDLSRGATVEDIVGAIALTAAWAVSGR